jgi:hypothetical protein
MALVLDVVRIANQLSDVIGVPATVGLPAYTSADWEARPDWYKRGAQHDLDDPVYGTWFRPGQPVVAFSARAPLPGETVPGETICADALFPAVPGGGGDDVVREWLAA